MQCGISKYVMVEGRYDNFCSYILHVLSMFFCPVPKMQFKESVYVANENDGQISAMIYRSGDIQHTSTVRCYTRQGSAQVMMDFEERPNTDSSIITFLPGKFLISF